MNEFDFEKFYAGYYHTLIRKFRSFGKENVEDAIQAVMMRIATSDKPVSNATLYIAVRNQLSTAHRGERTQKRTSSTEEIQTTRRGRRTLPVISRTVEEVSDARSALQSVLDAYKRLPPHKQQSLTNLLSMPEGVRGKGAIPGQRTQTPQERSQLKRARENLKERAGHK